MPAPTCKPVPTPRVEASTLRVAASRVPGAGLGLFATTRFARGEVVCVYRGTRLTLMEIMKGVDTSYVLGLSLNVHIDAKDHPQVFARYINDTGDSQHRNVTFEKRPAERRALVIATRTIEPGEELYVEYGSGYWKKRGIMPGTAPKTQPTSAPWQRRTTTWPAVRAATGLVLLVLAVGFVKRFRRGA